MNIYVSTCHGVLSARGVAVTNVWNDNMGKPGKKSSQTKFGLQLHFSLNVAPSGIPFDAKSTRKD